MDLDGLSWGLTYALLTAGIVQWLGWCVLSALAYGAAVGRSSVSDARLLRRLHGAA